MSKLQYLLSGGISNYDVIPQPDIAIIYEREKVTLVHAPCHLTDWQVVEYVVSKRGKGWFLGLWTNHHEINGELVKTRHENPHQNAMGMWVWLVVKG